MIKLEILKIFFYMSVTLAFSDVVIMVIDRIVSFSMSLINTKFDFSFGKGGKKI